MKKQIKRYICVLVLLFGTMGYGQMDGPNYRFTAKISSITNNTVYGTATVTNIVTNIVSFSTIPVVLFTPPPITAPSINIQEILNNPSSSEEDKAKAHEALAIQEAQEAQAAAAMAQIQSLLAWVQAQEQAQTQAGTQAQADAFLMSLNQLSQSLKNGGTVNTNTSANTTITWYMDNDGDGWHVASQQKATCPGMGWCKTTTKGLDCNDSDPTKTSDCSDLPPITGWFLDNDGDGYHATAQGARTSPGPGWTTTMTKGLDCDDTNATIPLLLSCSYVNVPPDENKDCNTSKEDLKKAFPNLSDNDAQKLADVLNAKGKDFGIDTNDKLRHFLAQASHETDGFNKLTSTESTYYSTPSRLEEVWPSRFSTTDTINKKNPNNYTKNSSKLANFVYANRMGNGNEASGDGYRYRGRGIFQLTGKDNYQSFTNAYNAKYNPDKNFITNPDLLATDNEIAILSALWFYQNRVLNKLTVDENTLVSRVTKKVNGGTVGIADRKTQYNNSKNNIDCK